MSEFARATRKLLDAAERGQPAMLTAGEARAFMAWARPHLVDVFDREMADRLEAAGTPEPDRE